MSNNTAPRALRRSLAATATIALASAGLFVGTSAALADNIKVDPETKGSILIHKFANPGDGSQNPGGTGQNPSKPIAGVTFEVCNIEGIDLTTGGNTGWDQVRAVTGPQLIAAQTGQKLGERDLVDCKTVVTGADGSAPAVDSLNLGAYLVREIDAPANVTKKADPFIVTVPTPTINGKDADGTWIYDVNVYPKNSVGDKPVKRIEDQTGVTGAVTSVVKFSVEQIVPGLEKGETYKKFIISDTLDSRLTGNAESAKVSVAGVDLEEGDFTSELVGQKLTVALTDTGLAKLKAGDVVKLTFPTTIDTIGDGEFDNTAYVNVNDMDWTSGGPGDPENPEPENPTNTVKSRWGQAKVTKIDPSEKGLEGAEFTVAMGNTAECTAETTFESVMDPKDTAKELVVTSGTGGVVNIPGLWVGNDSVSDTGEETKGFDQRCYRLIEVKAPAGFVLPEDNEHRIEIKTGETANVEKQIENVQQEVPELPLTGGAGQVLMIISGIALVAVAAGSVMVSRRKQQA
ncbi:SpaH/EbpB family LPXTG-anchored major pilin [Leucobacter chinensis]|uniref:SpaH/EbpB family LPXTG-anchored major pilin n=1 Tax=Leucobacter chinensis TaxID=2851010 RepID=UPI001C24306A|nr:SpaH/EbpB family LPXTG-anchored major pilin [Leucobacter chinensis]